MNYEQSNVGLGMVPHRASCRCDECRVERLERELADMTKNRDYWCDEYQSHERSFVWHKERVAQLEKELADMTAERDIALQSINADDAFGLIAQLRASEKECAELRKTTYCPRCHQGMYP
jgi:hypothetical protein